MNNEIKSAKAFIVTDAALIKAKVLNWLKPFNTFCFLDSCNLQVERFDFIAGMGMKRCFESSAPDALAAFQLFLQRKKSWLFGHLGYELNVDLPPHTEKEDHLQFPDIYFFEPEVIVYSRGNHLYIEAENATAVYEAIENTSVVTAPPISAAMKIYNRVTKAEYLNTIQQLQSHIHRGDCYEINYCVEFFAQNVEINPFELYHALRNISPSPFAGLYRLGDKWLVCSSPERFIKKEQEQIISQPIKGTLPRVAKDFSEELQKEQNFLKSNAKDRAENVMIVDLVRNDLSRICKAGSVQVSDLFEIRSFAQVHQMVSTVRGALSEGVGLVEILKAVFPMGSMTGAPKIRVMELIDAYENSKRGIFSGSLGYITPSGNFDFNVVIRSIMYNQFHKYLSFQAGSGITIYSDAEKEWEECLLKAKAIQTILSK